MAAVLEAGGVRGMAGQALDILQLHALPEQVRDRGVAQ